MYNNWTIYVDTKDLGRLYFHYEDWETCMTLLVNATIYQVWIVEQGGQQSWQHNS